MTAVVLVRHGRTPWHSPNRYTGRSDVPLDEVGVAQAGQLAVWAADQGFTALVSSDLTRAVQTAQPVAAATGLALRADPGLREVDFGIAEGRTLQQVRAIDPRAVDAFLADPVGGHFPGGEHPGRAAARFQAALASLAAAPGGARALVVAHSTIIRLAVCAALGLPLAEYRRRLPEVAPAAATILRLGDDGTPRALLAYNVATSERWRA